MTNHHAIRNAEEASKCYVYFDFEAGRTAAKTQTSKRLLYDDTKEGGKMSRDVAMKEGRLFVRLYRPYDVTIVQFADQTAVNWQRHWSLLPFVRGVEPKVCRHGTRLGNALQLRVSADVCHAEAHDPACRCHHRSGAW